MEVMGHRITLSSRTTTTTVYSRSLTQMHARTHNLCLWVYVELSVFHLLLPQPHFP